LDQSLWNKVVCVPRHFFFMQNLELLSKRIVDLPFTEEFKTVLKANDISTLKELVDMPVYDWHKKIVGFNYHDQHEVVSFLEANDLADLLIED
jgi:hypothetical protein